MPSDPRFLPVVRSAVGELACALGCGEQECRAVALAVDEALTNVIRHAYHNRYDRPIELLCEQRDNGLEFTILDMGEAPDPAKLCAGEPGIAEPGGRGTHVIREVMDTVCYTTTPEGNRLRLEKKFQKPRQGQP